MDVKDAGSSSSAKSSKELLYSEFIGTTVAEHVLESLEKKTNFNKSEKIKQFFKTEKTSGPLERARRLISVINGDEEKNVPETVPDNAGDIDVVVEIGESPSGSDASAWFILTQSNNELSESLDSELKHNSAIETEKNLLELESDSTDSSDDESEKVLPPFSEKKIPNIVLEDSSDTSQSEGETNIDSTDTSDDENDNSVSSFTEKSFRHIVMDISSDNLEAENELHISSSSKRKITEIENDSLDCSDFESVSKQKICDSTVNEKPNFVSDNSSNCPVLATSDQNTSVACENDFSVTSSEIFLGNSFNCHILADSSQNVSAPAKKESVNSVESSKISSSDSLSCRMLADSSQHCFVSAVKENAISVKSPEISSSDSLNCCMLADTSQYESVPADVKEFNSVESSKVSSSDSSHNHMPETSTRNVSVPVKNDVLVESSEMSSNENLQFCPIPYQRKRKLSSIDCDSLSMIDSKDVCQKVHVF